MSLAGEIEKAWHRHEHQKRTALSDATIAEHADRLETALRAFFAKITPTIADALAKRPLSTPATDSHVETRP